MLQCILVHAVDDNTTDTLEPQKVKIQGAECKACHPSKVAYQGGSAFQTDRQRTHASFVVDYPNQGG